MKRPQVKSHKSEVFVYSLLFFGLLMSGCAGITEVTKGVAGVSTRELEQSRPSAIKKEFNFSFDSAYGKVLAALSDAGAYVYSQNKGKKMIAVYVSSLDTTPVGVFFTVSGENTTLIEVSSASTYAKELISRDIFDCLEGKNIKKKVDKE